MPALPADIYAASRDVVNASWESATIASRYPSARDGTLEPAEGFFDDVVDAQVIADARGALIGVERRRFTGVAQGLQWPDLSAGTPTVTLTDGEQATTGLPALVARIELDLDAETTSYELFG